MEGKQEAGQLGPHHHQLSCLRAHLEQSQFQGSAPSTRSKDITGSPHEPKLSACKEEGGCPVWPWGQILTAICLLLWWIPAGSTFSRLSSSHLVLQVRLELMNSLRPEWPPAAPHSKNSPQLGAELGVQGHNLRGYARRRPEPPPAFLKHSPSQNTPQWEEKITFAQRSHQSTLHFPTFPPNPLSDLGTSFVPIQNFDYLHK